MVSRIVQLRRALPILLCALFLGQASLALAAKTPEWVERNGVAEAYPHAKFLVGFAEATGKGDALESAKQQAAADLARQISVQIESSVVDTIREAEGKFANDLTSQIRATSDIRLEGIRFETHRKRKKVWALAVLERHPAASARRSARDRALSMTASCLDGAAAEEEAGRSSEALRAYRGCRTHLQEALEHEAIAAALRRGSLLKDEVGEQLARHASNISARIRAIPHEDATSIRVAAERLAEQLTREGVGRGRQIAVAPLLYQGRDISSPFGRELSMALEAAIARTASQPGRDVPVSQTTRAKDQSGPVVIRGTYRENDDRLQIRVTAKAAESGVLLASGEIGLLASGVPSGIATRPANFESFAADADKLAGGDVVSGSLRVEVRTDRGLRGIVYDEGDELSLYVRVNQPAWIRLIYVLTSGDHVPITQEWYIDESQVNQLVEYPDSFEIIAPFGVEMIHAMASTEKPPKLVTRATVIDGESYVIIPDGADQVVRTRGIARKKKKQVAEQTLSLTTMRRPLQ